MTDQIKQHDHSKRDLDTLTIIGAFLGIFGLAVIVAVFFTDTYHGKVVNLLSGTLILIIGLVGIIKGRWSRRKE